MALIINNRYIKQAIFMLVGRINNLINQQINNIIHNKQLQKIEASWRSLARLIEEIKENHTCSVTIKLIDVNCYEISLDIKNNTNFANSQLFRKIHTEEFDSPGGEPFSIIIADYDFSVKENDVNILQHISAIAATSFCPIIAGADAELCDLENWSHAKPFHNYMQPHSKQNHLKWMRLCTSNNSQFIGLMSNKIKARELYHKSPQSCRNYFFTEKGDDYSDYLWANSAYRYISAVIAAFDETGWFLKTRATLSMKNNKYNLTTKRCNKLLTQQNCSELIITDEIEAKLNNAGLMVLRENIFTKDENFYFQPSIYRLEDKHASNFDDSNLRTQIPYLLCACRIAQTLKFMMRDKVGKFETADSCKTWLSSWLLNFCSSEQSPQNDTLFKYPLNKAEVEITEVKGKPGHFHCNLAIKPHSLIEGINSSLRLSTPIELNTQSRSCHEQ
jgi:type VI secretion system protein ImpD